jgi:hypothetical protein
MIQDYAYLHMVQTSLRLVYYLVFMWPSYEDLIIMQKGIQLSIEQWLQKVLF